MTCCFTGHRHFPWGDDTESPHRKDLLAGLENAVDWALVEGVTHFICGNAVGVDTWAAEMVLQKKKSHPEIFLEAARKLSVPITHCLVVEDSVNGLKAAKAAGAFSCMIPDLTPYTEELAPFCDYVCDSLLDCMALIETLNRKR